MVPLNTWKRSSLQTNPSFVKPYKKKQQKKKHYDHIWHLIYMAWQINRIKGINNTDRIDNGSIDPCKLGLGSILRSIRILK